MARELKNIVAAEFERRFEGVEGAVIIDYQRLNAEKTLELRSVLRKDGVRMRVVHNRLAKRVFGSKDDVPEGFGDLLSGPCALLVGEEGVITTSKAITNWRKKNKDVAEIKGGYFDGEVLSVADIARLATTPGKDELRADVAGRFIAPAQNLGACAKALVEHFAGCVKSRREGMEE